MTGHLDGARIRVSSLDPGFGVGVCNACVTGERPNPSPRWDGGSISLKGGGVGGT